MEDFIERFITEQLLITTIQMNDRRVEMKVRELDRNKMVKMTGR